MQKELTSDDLPSINEVLKTVTDPEIPVLTIDEMGIRRDVKVVNGSVVVTITPTYSGCPAMDQITSDVNEALSQHGYLNAQVNLVLSPAWTTEWMTDEAKEKLRAYGIAPPCKLSTINQDQEHYLTFKATCPQCSSLNTKVTSEFGSTACKSLWKCLDCLEPFDFFKPI